MYIENRDALRDILHFTIAMIGETEGEDDGYLPMLTAAQMMLKELRSPCHGYKLVWPIAVDAEVRTDASVNIWLNSIESRQLVLDAVVYSGQGTLPESIGRLLADVEHRFIARNGQISGTYIGDIV